MRAKVTPPPRGSRMDLSSEVPMTTLPDRPNTALLVTEVQNGVMAGAHNRNGVIATIAGLVERARSEDVPVVWVQHTGDTLPRGSDSWQYVPELAQRESEPVVHKSYGDSFEATDLDAVRGHPRVGARVVSART